MSDYNIKKGVVLHLILRLRGMISNFSEFDESDPLTAYLMKEGVGDNVPEKLLKEKRKELGGYKACGLKVEYTSSKLLDSRARNQLIGVANYVHAMHQIEGKSETLLQDIKIVCPPGFVDKITRARIIEDKLKAYHSNEIVKFVLRRTSSTTGCIPWHVDGAYSTCAVQYALNDDRKYQVPRWKVVLLY